MGLDMYLTGKMYLSGSTKQKKLQAINKTPFRAESIEYEIGYWRKDNQIHKWFVDNVQDGRDDGGTYYVSQENLEELLEAVNLALKSKRPSKILPTQAGFFFGGTAYDEYYFLGLKNTKEIIEKFMKWKDKDVVDLYYMASW